MFLESMTSNLDGSETTLSYRRMVERYPNLKEEVGGFESQLKIPSLPDGKNLSVYCALALACRPFVSKRKKEKKTSNFDEAKRNSLS
jgi:hypothetical protein